MLVTDVAESEPITEDLVREPENKEGTGVGLQGSCAEPRAAGREVLRVELGGAPESGDLVAVKVCLQGLCATPWAAALEVRVAEVGVLPAVAGGEIVRACPQKATTSCPPASGAPWSLPKTYVLPKKSQKKSRRSDSKLAAAWNPFTKSYPGWSPVGSIDRACRSSCFIPVGSRWVPLS